MKIIAVVHRHGLPPSVSVDAANHHEVRLLQSGASGGHCAIRSPTPPRSQTANPIADQTRQVEKNLTPIIGETSAPLDTLPRLLDHDTLSSSPRPNAEPAMR